MSFPPIIVPSFVVVGKEEAVVILFKNDFSSSQELVTLDFFQDGTKVDTSPCNQLGPNTIKTHFPAFSKPGMIEVSPKIAREHNPLFPKFKVHVVSPVEAIYNRLPCSRMQDKKAILSCILSYITHQPSEDAENARLQADTIICTLLSSMSEIPSWGLASFLCGDHELNDDNLLHFAARYHLDGMAEMLARRIKKKLDVLWQLSSDKKTPLQLAKKNGMGNVVKTLERLQASYGPQDKKPGKKKPVKKTRKGHVEQEEKDANQNLKISENKVISEPDHQSVSNMSLRTSTISTVSGQESIYHSERTETESYILKAINDISNYLYKAKITQNYLWSSYPHGELTLKVGDIVYVTQEKDADLCMGIADLSYGEFPRNILQQIDNDDPASLTDGNNYSTYYKVPRIQCVYIDEDNSDNEEAVPSPIYDIPRSARLQRKQSDCVTNVQRSYSFDTGLDLIEKVDVSMSQSQGSTLPLLLPLEYVKPRALSADLDGFQPFIEEPISTDHLQVSSSTHFLEAKLQLSSASSINSQETMQSLPLPGCYQGHSADCHPPEPSMQSPAPLCTQEMPLQPPFSSSQKPIVSVSSTSTSTSYHDGMALKLSVNSCEVESPLQNPPSSAQVPDAALQSLFTSSQYTIDADTPCLFASCSDTTPQLQVSSNKKEAIIITTESIHLQKMPLLEKKLTLPHISEETKEMVLGSEEGTAVTTVASSCAQEKTEHDIRVAPPPNIPLDAAKRKDTPSMPTSPRPVPKPRKNNSIISSTAPQTNSEFAESNNSTVLVPLESVQAATNSCNRGSIPIAVSEMPQETKGDSTVVSPLPTTVTKKIAPPISPRLKKLQTVNVNNPPPAVSPRLKRLQTDPFS